MKKFLFFLLTVVSISLLTSCGGEKNASNTSSNPAEEKGMKYVDEENGYSIDLPPGFAPADESNPFGIRQFIKGGCMISIEVKDIELEKGKNVTQMVKEKYEELKKGITKDDSEEEVKMLDDLSLVHKWRAEPDLNADIEIYKNGKIFLISFEGVGETSESYDEFIDIMSKSLKME
ncbi:MAG: hypothetical protein IKW83_03680 [Muribaculaceae bacterium]|nr:hypothetical protein [Muribaculaceae bacterium]